MQVKPATKGEILSSIAPLLEYPQSDFFDSLDSICLTIKETNPQAYKSLQEFKALIKEYKVSELEEIYTRTFDVAPVCSPYVSVHIYGDENFDRGNLMATLATKFEERQFQSPNELPDHLAVLLRFARYLTSEELEELIEFCFKEPLENMSGSLKGSKKPNPYYFPLVSVIEILKSKPL